MPYWVRAHLAVRPLVIDGVVRHFAGYGYNARAAQRCDQGTYNEGGNLEPCKQCPLGTSTSAPGAGKSIEDCWVSPGYGAAGPCPLGESLLTHILHHSSIETWACLCKGDCMFHSCCSTTCGPLFQAESSSSSGVCRTLVGGSPALSATGLSRWPHYAALRCTALHKPCEVQSLHLQRSELVQPKQSVG